MQHWPEFNWSRSVDLIPEHLSPAIPFAREGHYRNRTEGYWENR
jgi:hypothetical protein